jgi:hypothetical protein
MDSVTLTGLTIIFFYCITKILKFYGLNESDYAVYIFFYILIALCILVLPTEDTSF